MAKLYITKPEGFMPDVEFAGCYIEIDYHILLLQNGNQKKERGKWGVPGGKLEMGETALDAARRELWEETGISLSETIWIEALEPLYVCKPDINYTYHLFKIHLKTRPNVMLSDEHQEYRWVGHHAMEEIPFMDAARESMHYYHERKLL